MLILAGVTIAMLTGSDSAPAKANEAKQKNDIGAARDQVYLFASNAQTEAYETVYVRGKKTDNSGDDVTAGRAGEEVSKYVKKLLNQEYPEDGTKKVGLATIVATEAGVITISTTDWKQEGNVSETGGTLTWGGLTQNIPTPEPVEDTGGNPAAPNSVQSLAQTGTIQVGDYVNYNPGTATSVALNLPQGASLDETLSATDSSGWYIININQSTGEVLIIPESKPSSLLIYNFNPSSVEESIDNLISAYNICAGIFKNEDYAKFSRAVTLADFGDLFDDGGVPLSSHVLEDGTIDFPGGYDWYIDGCYGCLLANKSICDGQRGVLIVGDSNVESRDLEYCDDELGFSICPVVSLKSGIQMTKDGNNVWQLSRGD